MARKLGEWLLARQWVAQVDIDEALKLQKIYGGRLGTLLVEMEKLQLEQLCEALKSHLAMPVASGGMLQELLPNATGLMTAEQVEKFQALPLRNEGRKLHVAFCAPQNVGVVEELQFTMGMRVVPYVVPELLFFDWAKRAYGIDPPLRYIKLAPDPHAPPPRPSAPPTQRPSTSSPRTAAPSGHDALMAERAALFGGPASSLSELADTDDRDPPPAPTPARVAAPMPEAPITSPRIPLPPRRAGELSGPGARPVLAPGSLPQGRAPGISGSVAAPVLTPSRVPSAPPPGSPPAPMAPRTTSSPSLPIAPPSRTTSSPSLPIAPPSRTTSSPSLPISPPSRPGSGSAIPFAAPPPRTTSNPAIPLSILPRTSSNPAVPVTSLRPPLPVPPVAPPPPAAPVTGNDDDWKIATGFAALLAGAPASETPPAPPVTAPPAVVAPPPPIEPDADIDVDVDEEPVLAPLDASPADTDDGEPIVMLDAEEEPASLLESAILGASLPAPSIVSPPPEEPSVELEPLVAEIVEEPAPLLEARAIVEAEPSPFDPTPLVVEAAPTIVEAAPAAVEAAPPAVEAAPPAIEAAPPAVEAAPPAVEAAPPAVEAAPPAIEAAPPAIEAAPPAVEAAPPAIEAAPPAVEAAPPAIEAAPPAVEAAPPAIEAAPPAIEAAPQPAELPPSPAEVAPSAPVAAAEAAPPADSPPTPAAEAAPPAAEAAPPAAEAAPPADSPPTPAAEAAPPADSPPTAVVEAPPAVVEAPPAVADAPPPVADAPPPVADAPPPVADAPPPVADAPPPVADAPPPVADAPPPVADAPPPVADAPPPVADAPPALAAAPVPVPVPERSRALDLPEDSEPFEVLPAAADLGGHFTGPALSNRGSLTLSGPETREFEFAGEEESLDLAVDVRRAAPIEAVVPSPGAPTPSALTELVDQAGRQLETITSAAGVLQVMTDFIDAVSERGAVLQRQESTLVPLRLTGVGSDPSDPALRIALDGTSSFQTCLESGASWRGELNAPGDWDFASRLGPTTRSVLVPVPAGEQTFMLWGVVPALLCATDDDALEFDRFARLAGSAAVRLGPATS
jgi:hypothetical protein